MSLSTYNWCYFWVAGRVLQITAFDACDFLSVVDDFGPWLDECVKHDVAVEVDDRDACQPVTFLRENPLTV